MAEKKTSAKNKGGRPRKVINQKQFEELCHIQCTQEEICAVLDVSDEHINKWCKDTYGKGFLEVFRQKREGGKTSLRRKQWLLADTNASMAIFLGKNMLGQTDKREEESDATTKLLQNMTTLAETISRTVPNRNIEDMEE